MSTTRGQGETVTRAEEKIEQLQVADILVVDNQRKSMDKGKFEELKASIQERGVETPIWVRANPRQDHSGAGSKGWVLIAGSRRLRASVELTLPTIPSIVKQVASDQEAMILSCIENDQREGVNPMEQALAYQDALNKGSHTPETLADKLGQKLPYVLGRLKLLKISKKAQKALQDGEIEYGHALLITRLKDHKDQDEFLDAIFTYEWDRKLTVKEAGECLDNYSARLASAPFDVKTVCATCSARSRSQIVLFPEEAKKDDKCLDKACFQRKTREHYEKQASELEAKGIKVLITPKAVQAAKAGKNSLVISPDPQDHNHPKKYKSMCAAPCENRAVYIYTDPNSHARKVETGEICLDRKCFNEMNGKKETMSSSSFPSRRSQNNASRVHALAMRDRFLREKMPAKVEPNETLQRRLLLFHFLCRFDRFTTALKPELKKDQDQTLAELLREYCPAWKHESLLDEQKLFAAVSMIPAVSLAAVTRKALLASVPFTDADVLLQGMGEAGLSFEKDFQVDSLYLYTKTKGELVDLAVKKFGLPAAAAGTDMKKPEIIKGIMGHKLTGKVPPEIAKECKLVTLGTAKAKKGTK